MRRFLFILALASSALAAGPAPVVIDRIAVIVGKRLIKSSDIDRDLRVTEFLNREPLVLTPEARRKAAERLIDQSLIREEVSSGGFTWATYADATGMLDQLRRDRYQNSDARLRAELARYGLTEAELREQLLLQLTVIRFIDQRFRPGILISDDDVRKYYDQHLVELRRQYPGANSYVALAPQIRTSLEGEKINEEFEAWLAEARKDVHIEYREGAFQ